MTTTIQDLLDELRGAAWDERDKGDRFETPDRVLPSHRSALRPEVQSCSTVFPAATSTRTRRQAVTGKPLRDWRNDSSEVLID